MRAVASFRALQAISRAVVERLGTEWSASNGEAASFDVFNATNFRPLGDGATQETRVSLFAYRLNLSGHNRGLPGRLGGDATERPLPRLPLEVKLMVTAWAADAEMEQVLAVWAMRALADRPLYSAADLNTASESPFLPDEVVELSPDDQATEDLLRLWEVLGAQRYHLSVPYVARTILVDSVSTRAGDHRDVEEREFRYHRPTTLPGAEHVD